MDHCGYSGKLLRVNLESGDVGVEQPDAAYYERYLGGRGIIMHTLLTEVPAKADPLGAENKLVFAMGLLTGHRVIGSGRCSVGAKSPLTGACGESEAGGWWGAELRRADKKRSMGRKLGSACRPREGARLGVCRSRGGSVRDRPIGTIRRPELAGPLVACRRRRVQKKSPRCAQTPAEVTRTVAHLPAKQTVRSTPRSVARAAHPWQAGEGTVLRPGYPIEPAALPGHPTGVVR